MAAGESAGAEARRQRALADAHERAAREARAAAGRFDIAASTEKRTAQRLSPLAAFGHHLLADRRWPGTRRAQIDLVVVGPGGVFIVDTKAWKDVTITADRVFRGDDDVTEDLLTLTGIADVAQADLAEVGLAAGEVRIVVVLAGRGNLNANLHGIRIVGEHDVLAHIAGYGTRLTEAQVDLVLGRALALFPQVRAAAPVVAAVPEPVVAIQPVEPQAPLISVEEVERALLTAQMAAPIEDWMVFLHPKQAKVARRPFTGPSRIRGPAGTGKTVVGLHRAAHLARSRAGKVLFTTYVRTLPAVQRALLRRMAPDIVDRVDFFGIHAFARELLSERGVTVKVDLDRAEDAFARAWVAVGKRSVLAEISPNPTYWKDEIQHVLKGRGITDFAYYADLARTGRKQRLHLGARRAVWDLYETYDEELRRRGINDIADLILLAEAELKREPLEAGYSAVVIDEAQDLSCAMVWLLHRLVGDADDGLTLIGDGQQSIYPGGYALSEAGISIAGRGVVLDVNYRNTEQILAFAQQAVIEDEFFDIEGSAAKGDIPASVPRTGDDPVEARWANPRERDAQMVARVRALLREAGTRLGDIGVLCVTRSHAHAARNALTQSGIATIRLEDYAGTTSDAVKVGTIKRAKGLEFKHVLVPDMTDFYQADAPADDDPQQERWNLIRRELYVAMTRARDSLWVGVKEHTG